MALIGEGASPLIGYGFSTKNVLEVGIRPGNVDPLLLQSISDTYGDLYWPEGVYNLSGTVYQGDSVWYGDGKSKTIINIVADVNFQRLGPANRRNEGAIISKAAAGSGYSALDTYIGYADLTINHDRTDGTNGVQTAIIPENTRGGIFERSDLNVTASAGLTTSGLDCYAGVQGFTVQDFVFDMSGVAAGQIGGNWVRNFSSTRATENVILRNGKIITSATDEGLAIFNQAGVDSVMRNIGVENVYVDNAGNGNCFAFLNNRNVAEENFTGMYAKNVICKADALVQGNAVFKFINTSATLEGCKAIIKDNAVGATQTFGFRNVSHDGARSRPKLDDCSVILDGGTNNTNIVEGYADHISAIDCYSTALNGATFKNNLFRMSGRIRGGHHSGCQTRPMSQCRYASDVEFDCDYDIMGQAYLVNFDIATTFPEVVWKDLVFNVSGTTNQMTAGILVNTTSRTQFRVDGFHVKGNASNLPASPNSIINAAVITAQFDNVIYDDGTTPFRESEPLDV